MELARTGPNVARDVSPLSRFALAAGAKLAGTRSSSPLIESGDETGGNLR